MGRAISVRTDYLSGEVRRLAQRAKNAGQARRLLAIAAVLDGSTREDAARVGGLDRQTGLGDPVQRAGAGRADQHSVAGRAGQAQRRAQGLSHPHRRRRPDACYPWRRPLAGL